MAVYKGKRAFKLCNPPRSTTNDQILVQRQLTQLQQHLLRLREVITLNCASLPLQREQVLRSWLWHHPVTPGHKGNLEGHSKVPDVCSHR